MARPLRDMLYGFIVKLIFNRKTDRWAERLVVGKNQVQI